MLNEIKKRLGLYKDSESPPEIKSLNPNFQVEQLNSSKNEESIDYSKNEESINSSKNEESIDYSEGGKNTLPKEKNQGNPPTFLIDDNNNNNKINYSYSYSSHSNDYYYLIQKLIHNQNLSLPKEKNKGFNMKKEGVLILYTVEQAGILLEKARPLLVKRKLGGQDGN